MEDTASQIEQRRHPREPARRKVYLVSGGFAAKCGLVDIAAGGARVRLPNEALPSGDLYLVDMRTGLIHLTNAVWQSEREAGLQFIETETLDHTTGGVIGAAEAAAAFARRRARAAASDAS